jgi:hypothetical protein
MKGVIQMEKQKAKTNIKKQKVTFSLNAPEAKRVF